MQYHFDGFRSGDPHIQPEQAGAGAPPDKVDVLIVGCGPAGLTMAAQLAAFPDITTRIVERKPGPLEIGQADGIACRSMEMFEAFGFADKVKREAYWVNETTFWRPDDSGGLTRGDRIQDVEDDLSEMPHTILSQARVHDFFLEVMRNAPTRLVPDYGLSFDGFTRDEASDFPIRATFKGVSGTSDQIIHAKYLVGCDGARSGVRDALGYRLKGEAARQLWGVMDVLAVTDFPDIRLKAAIQSAEDGSILIIPREGGTMVRLYIELDSLNPEERASDRGVTSGELIAKAQKILAPYTLDVREVAWFSAYEIGQRICDSFDDLGPEPADGAVPRVFIAGDACHTHSPKAGQGMNVSMADTFNLGWKLAAVLRGQATPELLRSYSSERHAKAQELIDFDRDMARLFSARSEDSGFADRFQSYFKQHGRYTAGVATQYGASRIVSAPDQQSLAQGLVVGMRFHSAPVIRLADAKPLQLGHVLRADGRWRLVMFAPDGDTGHVDGQIAKLCDYLDSDSGSPINRFTPTGDDRDTVIECLAVFQGSHRDLESGKMPSFLTPRTGRLQLIDYEKIFCADARLGMNIFDLRRIDRTQGALVVVRPDQSVADVMSLSDQARVAGFFDDILLKTSG